MKLTQQQLLREAFLEGVVEATRNWAWWKNGQQYVGSCGTTLAEALDKPERELSALRREKEMLSGLIDPTRRIEL